MTLVSESHRFVFVHVPKSGGTSVKYALGHLQSERHAGLLRANKHIGAGELPQLLPDVALDDWYTFAFVRNPFDQLRSYWTYKTEHPFHPDYAATVAAGSFEGWVQMFADDPRRLQCSYTHDRGRQLVDFVGRYERLADDFAVVADRIGIGPVDLPCVNRSTNSGRIDAYPRGLRRLVVERWRADFEAFGYDS
jgi:hypothetical protein